jgi:hypothetical protein
VRQRPGTAKGVLFLTIEDETGNVNVIVWASLVEQQRREVLNSHLLGVYGVWQREGEVRHLVAKRLVDMSFSYISCLTGYTFGMVVRSDSPIMSIKDMVDYAKANPGKFSYGSTGTGTTPHIAVEQFCKKAGIQLLHVPYKGNAEGMQAVLGGHVMAHSDATGWGPHVDAGRCRLLATYGSKRTKRWPNVPTLNELGYATVSDSPFRRGRSQGHGSGADQAPGRRFQEDAGRSGRHQHAGKIRPAHHLSGQRRLYKIRARHLPVGEGNHGKPGAGQDQLQARLCPAGSADEFPSALGRAARPLPDIAKHLVGARRQRTPILLRRRHRSLQFQRRLPGKTRIGQYAARHGDGVGRAFGKDLFSLCRLGNQAHRNHRRLDFFFDGGGKRHLVTRAKRNLLLHRKAA